MQGIFIFLICLVSVFSNVKGQDITGNWTGFDSGFVALYDWYTIQYSNSTGTFTVFCNTICGWTNGTGQVQGTAVKLSLNTGVDLVGQITFDSQECGWTDAPSNPCPLPPPFKPSCTTIVWDNDTTWVLLQPIDKVHVVFMNHLDVGYNGIPLTGFINNILNIYFHEYYPRAISVAETMATLNLTDTLIYTTHPWLVSLYLDCPPNLVLAGIPLKCPSALEVEAMTAAIKKGTITWHRGPFNLQPENMEASLFEYSLSVAADLDKLFGFPPKNTLSQRDVPGMTRGVVPILAANNIAAVSVGVNGYSCPPAVPKAFVWKDNQSNTDVIALWHSGGYPNNPGANAALPGGLSRGDCVTIPGFREALCWAFRTDNSGPPEDLVEVLSNFAVIRAQFPGANVFASTFDNFINALIPFKANLQVFTQEIGDVWVQGIASDPYKMAQYRTITRARAACLQSGKCSVDDPVLKNMSRWLIKPPEHTWGLPQVGDGQTSLWSNAQFESVRNQQIYTNCEEAWIEQRQFNQIAVDTLVQANHPLADIVLEELSLIEPQRPSTTGYSQVSNFVTPFECNGNTIQFDKTGAIVNLTDQFGNTWASATAPLNKLIYTTWDQTGYNSSLPCNLVLGGKPGSNEAHPVNADWTTSVSSMWSYSLGGQTCSFLVQVAMGNETVSNYGGFPEGWITYNISNSAEQVSINIDYQWFSKTSTRLAESFMLAFTPVQKTGYTWQMNKLGSSVSPLDVIQGGSQSQHAVWAGVAYTAPSSGAKSMQILTTDVPLVSPITTTTAATPIVNSVSPLRGDMLGFGFNLYNNVWNTNYILWYPLLNVEGKDERLRFQIVIA